MVPLCGPFPSQKGSEVLAHGLYAVYKRDKRAPQFLRDHETYPKVEV